MNLTRIMRFYSKNESREQTTDQTVSSKKNNRSNKRQTVTIFPIFLLTTCSQAIGINDGLAVYWPVAGALHREQIFWCWLHAAQQQPQNPLMDTTATTLRQNREYFPDLTSFSLIFKFHQIYLKILILMTIDKTPTYF